MRSSATRKCSDPSTADARSNRRDEVAEVHEFASAFRGLAVCCEATLVTTRVVAVGIVPSVRKHGISDR